MTNISDSLVDRCWIFGGFDQARVAFGGNHRFTRNIFESSGHHGLMIYESAADQILENAFYTTAGAFDDGGTNSTASLLLQSDPTFSYPTFGTVIGHNVFYKGLYAHGINASNVANIVLSGNSFNLAAGTFNPGTKDDIHLFGVTNCPIFGNSSSAFLNDYIPGNRGSKWVVNTDATCKGIKLLGNSFTPGISGTFNDQTSER
jgi:hypothetical protein